jgi:antitoxin ParD1/3/4
MPTRNVNLTKEMDRFIARCVKSGHYANASEVMRSALRLLEREERDDRKMVRLREAIQKGLDSGIAEGDVFERIRKKHGLSKKVA